MTRVSVICFITVTLFTVYFAKHSKFCNQVLFWDFFIPSILCRGLLCGEPRRAAECKWPHRTCQQLSIKIPPHPLISCKTLLIQPFATQPGLTSYATGESTPNNRARVHTRARTCALMYLGARAHRSAWWGFG